MLDLELIIVQRMACQVNTDYIFFVFEFFDQSPRCAGSKYRLGQSRGCTSTKQTCLGGLLVFLKALPEFDGFFYTCRPITVLEKVLCAMCVLKAIESTGIG